MMGIGMSENQKNILTATSIKREVESKTGRLTILENVDLTLRAAESLAIQGTSGSGKSTLLSLLAGLDLPQQGRIVFDGQDICNLNEDKRAELRAQAVSFVFQSFHLIGDLTALENVALPLELFGQREANKIARNWLTKMGLGERAKHFPKQLSGGEQQRVALCRAFATQPRLLFADEPTANLDRGTAKVVMDALLSLQQQSGTSMIIATHDHTLAQRCDRIVHLEAGRLVDNKIAGA